MVIDQNTISLPGTLHEMAAILKTIWGTHLKRTMATHS